MAARRAHNPEVVGSSPASATIKRPEFIRIPVSGLFLYYLRDFREAENPAGVYLGVYGKNEVFEKRRKPNFHTMCCANLTKQHLFVFLVNHL